MLVLFNLERKRILLSYVSYLFIIIVAIKVVLRIKLSYIPSRKSLMISFTIHMYNTKISFSVTFCTDIVLIVSLTFWLRKVSYFFKWLSSSVLRFHGCGQISPHFSIPTGNNWGWGLSPLTSHFPRHLILLWTSLRETKEEDGKETVQYKMDQEAFCWF